MTADRPPDPAALDRSGAECRCHCGSLLARWGRDGIELKCRRCKRVIVLPVPARNGKIPIVP